MTSLRSGHTDTYESLADTTVLRKVLELASDLDPHSSDWASLARLLQHEVGTPPAPHEEALIEALSYDLTTPDEVGRRGRWGSALCELFVLQGHVYPRPVPLVEGHIVKLWADMLARSPESDAVNARLADLLWERKWGDEPRHWLNIAISAYRKVWYGKWPLAARETAVLRAWELSRESDKDNAVELSKLLAYAAEDILGRASEDVSSTVLALLTCLVHDPYGPEPIELSKLLDKARQQLKGKPIFCDRLFVLQLDTERDKALWKRIRDERAWYWAELLSKAPALSLGARAELYDLVCHGDPVIFSEALTHALSRTETSTAG
jgi:hypothetical protein